MFRKIQSSTSAFCCNYVTVDYLTSYVTWHFFYVESRLRTHTFHEYCLSDPISKYNYKHLLSQFDKSCNTVVVTSLLSTKYYCDADLHNRTGCWYRLTHQDTGKDSSFYCNDNINDDKQNDSRRLPQAPIWQQLLSASSGVTILNDLCLIDVPKW